MRFIENELNFNKKGLIMIKSLILNLDDKIFEEINRYTNLNHIKMDEFAEKALLDYIAIAEFRALRKKSVPFSKKERIYKRSRYI